MKFLIPIDGSAQAESAVDYVLNHAAAFSEPPQICLLNVQWKVATGNIKLFIDADTINDYYRELGMAALAPARAKLEAAKLSYEYHISVGVPAEAIVQYANQHEVDQIVMSYRGEGGLQALLLGSVVSKVLHLANCPVLVVK
jgi:nucleotide-binding universal stress UspA family protein